MDHKYLSKNYTAALAETGYDTDGTEWHTYRVFDNKGVMIGYTEILPTGITGLDESIIADLMDVPMGVSVTIEPLKS